MSITPLFIKRDAHINTSSPAPTSLAQLSNWYANGERDVFTVTAILTPETAEEILRRNPDNRKLRVDAEARSVKSYAGAMQRGEWVLNGETIIISRDGLLNDGQHRLSAIVRAGVAVPVMLTFGVERDTRHTVDQGAIRTNGSILAMYGYKNASALATAARFLWCLENGRPFASVASSDQIIATVEAHPGLEQAITECRHLGVAFRVSLGTVAVAFYLCEKSNAGVACDVLRRAHTGLGINRNDDPVFALRRRYQNHLTGLRPLDGDEVAALFIKAFNNTVNGEYVQHLSWRRDEIFPIVGG